MAQDSKIEWTHHTFNPWRGCTKVSAGCTHCYAETMSGRNPTTLGVWGPRGSRVVASESYWRQPIKWNKAAEAAGERHQVFCASLADVCEGRDTMSAASWEPVQTARRRLGQTIDATPWLDYLLLTKRPENIAATFDVMFPNGANPRPNIWWGTSVEDQAAADERIPHLLRCPAAVRFLSCEPLLGPVDLRGLEPTIGPLGIMRKPNGDDVLRCYGPRIHWVIVGGESGPGARPCNIDWIRSLRDQCAAAGVATFIKQVGAGLRMSFAEWNEEWQGLTDKHGFTLDGPQADYGIWRGENRKGGDWSEWPDDLRVREFPEVAHA
jgi:protein gp37